MVPLNRRPLTRHEYRRARKLLDRIQDASDELRGIIGRINFRPWLIDQSVAEGDEWLDQEMEQGHVVDPPRPIAAFFAAIGLALLLCLMTAWAIQTAWNLYIVPRGAHWISYSVALAYVVGGVLVAVIAVEMIRRIRKGVR